MDVLFPLTLLSYVLATIMYVVWFVKQQKESHLAARWILTAAGILHTMTLVARYFEVGHTPITNMHEAVS
ncbi:MAG: c-type cytochrome biogenesis protein CcsB, partial [Desulfobulbaceae bacterium]|nr:c-type cytochrome biogenesis protein CcsB [Desulfobulbaceae bacterium]